MPQIKRDTRNKLSYRSGPCLFAKDAQERFSGKECVDFKTESPKTTEDRNRFSLLPLERWIKMLVKLMQNFWITSWVARA